MFAAHSEIVIWLQAKSSICTMRLRDSSFELRIYAPTFQTPVWITLLVVYIVGFMCEWRYYHRMFWQEGTFDSKPIAISSRRNFHSFIPDHYSRALLRSILCFPESALLSLLLTGCVPYSLHRSSHRADAMVFPSVRRPFLVFWNGCWCLCTLSSLDFL